MGRLVQLLCLAMAVAPACIFISSQQIVKDPDFCTQYVNMSNLFNNTNSTVNEVVLGYQELVWLPFEEQTESPCVYLTDTENRNLFIQVQGNGQLCIDIDTASICSNGRIELCSPSEVTSGRQNVYFTCQESCSTSSIPFFYRIIQSANTGNLEYWCDDIVGPPNDLFPEDVLFEEVGGTAVSFSRDFQQTPATVGTGGAVGIVSSLSVVSILALFILLV